MEGINTSGYPSMEWPSSLDIPLRASEEVVSIDLENDLPDDTSDLKTLLVEEGSDKEHWLTIAIAYCNHGKTREGVRLIEMALESFENVERASLHTFLSWAHLNIAKENSISVEIREHELTQAEVHLKNAIGFDPTWIGNMLATIDLYYQRGHYDRALETCDLFVKSIYAEDRRNGRTSKPNALFLLLRAKLLYQKKNYTASLRSFQELLVINPSMQPDPRIGIGLCFWQLKDYKIAIASWKRALNLNSENKNAAILVLLGDYHNSLTTSENDLSFQENYSKVLQDLNNLYNDDKHNPVLLTLLQSYYYFKGDYQKVLNIYETKIKKVSSVVSSSVLSESMFWSGRAYYALQDYRKAFIMFQQSLKQNEDNLLAKFGFGQTQMKNKLVEESILTFENLYKNYDGIQELNYILGLLYAGKCLDSQTSKHLARNEVAKLTEKAIQYLNKYIKLTTSKKNQIVVPRAYLVISQLYEIQNNYKQALEFLSKALEQFEEVQKDSVPLEILNNLGCFNFLNGELEAARGFFETAKQRDNEKSNITLEYNIARTFESIDTIESQSLYDKILSDHPSYIYARIRSLFSKYMQEKGVDLALENDVNALLAQNKADLEVRSFYSWFLKKNKGESKSNENLETAHNKETLVKYDSHDLYALISLGNLYCMIGRTDKKSQKPKDQENSKQSFLKAVQLFQKVLQLDPFNIFAAQGIAIVFAESKRMGPAIEILRKVRDSLDNEDVHVNIAHCLLEMHEFAKAIESYEFALKRFGDAQNKPKLLNLLGKAWYSRGVRERSLEFFQKALMNAEMALDMEKKNSLLDKKFLASLNYNVALLHFQIAETLRRSNPKERRLVDIQDAMSGLKVGLSILKELKDLKEFLIIPKDELEQRIQLGETTMQSALERSVKEQEQYETEKSEKLEEGRKLLEENELQEQERLKREGELSRIKLEKQKEEYKKLQEEAQKSIQERENILSLEDEKNDMSDNAYENSEDAEGKKNKKKRKSTRKGTAGEKKRRKKNEAKEEVQSEEAPSEKDEEDEDAAIHGGGRRGRKSTLSKEFIEDSDADDDDDDVVEEESGKDGQEDKEDLF